MRVYVGPAFYTIEHVPLGSRSKRSFLSGHNKELNPTSNLNTDSLNDTGVLTGDLKDGWTYSIELIPITNRFRATVLHPYGDALTGGVPWPIEDRELDANPTYSTAAEALSAAEGYIERLREVKGYPDPDKMSPRGLRPALW